MPAKQLLTIMEFLLFLTLFSFIGAFVTTTNENDRIVDATEEFTELVRYKGCVTKQMYEDFRNHISTPVKVNFIIDKAKVMEEDNAPLSQDFTADVLEALDASGIYTMSAGDQIRVVVRKLTPTTFDHVSGIYSGQVRGGAMPIIAIKGGLILNEQYH